MEIDLLECRLAQLSPFATRRSLHSIYAIGGHSRCFCTNRLRLATVRRPRRPVVLAHTDVHVLLNSLQILHNIGNDLLLKGPAEEVQLTNRGDKGLVTARLEHDPFAPTEGIEEPLRVGLELPLIVEIDEELPLVEDITDVVLFGIVRYEPINESQTDSRFTLQDREYSFEPPRISEEFAQPGHDELLFALDPITLRGVGASRLFHLH